MHRRASGPLRDDTGATAVILAVLLVVIVGLVALSIDGGMLWVKHRKVENASDAAALSWAQWCATNQAATAQAKAAEVAQLNAPGVTLRSGFPQYGPEGCSPGHGSVRVGYQGTQDLVFGPAVGVSSPKTVVGSATAIWGAAGGLEGLAPLMISAGRLNNCGIPNGTPPMNCSFWWHKDLLAQATWSVLNLSTWAIAANGGCTSSGADLNIALGPGWPSPLFLHTVPTYVCALSGVHGNVANQIVPGKFYSFPVNDPTKQVAADGTLCAPMSTTCQPDKYAIIGFAQLKVVNMYRGGQATQNCGPLPPGATGNGNYFCMVTVWTGWDADGLLPGGGSDFGVKAIGLTE
jgi:hypothetical protein